MSGPDPVIIVVLRQPRNRFDVRSDPFYEFGSFGITGCHGRLLASPSCAGARLAFVQGGHGTFRLVYLTPPVEIVHHREGREALWGLSDMPLQFDEAPILVAHDDLKATSTLARMVASVNRSSWAAKFASRFRSTHEPLPLDAAREVIETWNCSSVFARARSYDEALPFHIASPDRARAASYARLRRDAGASDRVAARGCRARSDSSTDPSDLVSRAGSRRCKT